MINENILKIANQASLRIITNDKIVKIKHNFSLNDKSNIGILFFLFSGLFLITLFLISSIGNTSKILVLSIGILLLIISILTLIRQVTDELIITDRAITFQFNLRRKTIPLSENIKIKKRIDKLTTRGGDLSNTFLIFTYYIYDLKNEIIIFNFSMHESNENNANTLSCEITRILNKKINQFKISNNIKTL